MKTSLLAWQLNTDMEVFLRWGYPEFLKRLGFGERAVQLLVRRAAFEITPFVQRSVFAS